MKKPLVSVVMPVYNKQYTINQSMQSIFDQSISDWELIVVDDASTDSSREMISTVDEKRLKRVFLPTNKGVVNAYKEGIKRANGKYIMFHDSDDLSLPDRAEKCLKVIGDADVLYHGIYVIARHPSIPLLAKRYKPALPWKPERIYKEQYIPGVIFAKKEILDKVKFPDEAKCAWDWMHHILLHQLGAKYVSLDDGLYEYYRYPDTSLSYKNEMEGTRQEAMKWIQKYLIKNKIVKKDHKFGKGFKAYHKNGKKESYNLMKEDKNEKKNT